VHLAELLTQAHKFAKSQDGHFIECWIFWFFFAFNFRRSFLQNLIDHLIEKRHKLRNKVLLNYLSFYNVVNLFMDFLLFSFHSTQNFVEFLLIFIQVLDNKSFFDLLIYSFQKMFLHSSRRNGENQCEPVTLMPHVLSKR
jgi:hypothetical protein